MQWSPELILGIPPPRYLIQRECTGTLLRPYASGAVPTFALFSSVYPLGGEQFPAPAAVAWKAVAEVLTSSANGGGGLPGEAKTMMVGAAMFAVGVRFVEHWGTARWGWGSGFRVQGSGFRVKGSECRVRESRIY